MKVDELRPGLFRVEEPDGRRRLCQVVVAGETWPLGGDIIVKADGVRVGSVDALRALIDRHKPGDRVQLEIYRGNKTMSVKVRLGRQPNSPRC